MFGISKKDKEEMERYSKMTLAERRQHSRQHEEAMAARLGITVEAYQEKRKKGFAKAEEYRRQRESGKPSSKIGQEIYWQRVGVLGLPFALWDSLRYWMNGHEVWYADDGFRHVTLIVRKDGF